MANSASKNAAISPDGSHVAFDSTSTNLIPNTQCSEDRNIFVWSTVTSTRQASCPQSENWFGNGGSGLGASNPSVSMNGEVVYQTGLEVPSTVVWEDNNQDKSDIVFTSGSNQSSIISYRESSIGGGPTLTFTGNADSFTSDISADGKHVAFSSASSDLWILGDNNDTADIFVRYERDGQSVLNLISVNPDGQQFESLSFDPSISENGDHVAFVALGDRFQIYVRDRRLNGADLYDTFAGSCTSLISQSAAGVIGDGQSYDPSISADGRFIAFYSDSTNLVSGDTNGVNDVFVVDRDPDQDGSFYSDEANCIPNEYAILRASVSSDGVEGDGSSNAPDLSANGRFVVFASAATNLVLGDTNGVADVFVHYLAFENAPVLSGPFGPTEPEWKIFIPVAQN